MADTLTEFSNLTGQTYSALSAGVTIASTATGQQAVIKDVVVNDKYGRNYELRVGSQVVGSCSGDSKFSGSEILGPNSTLKVHATQTPLVTGFMAFSSLTAYVPHTLLKSDGTPDLLLTGNRTTSLACTSTTQTITSLTGGGAGNYCFGANGDFYYKPETSGTSGNIYRRAGGVNGTETTIVSGIYEFAFDGRYIYILLDTGIIRRYDTLTNTLDAQKAMIGAYSPAWDIAYAKMCAMDGFIWINVGNASFGPMLVNWSTGQKTGLVGSVSASSSTSTHQFCAMAKNAAGEYCILRTHASAAGSLKYDVLSSLADGATVVRSGSVQSSNYVLPVYTGTLNALRSIVGVDNFIFYIRSGVLRAFDLTTMSEIQSVSLTGNNYSASYATYPVLASDVTSHFGTLSARATGVLVTA